MASESDNYIPDLVKYNDSIYEFHTPLTYPKDPTAEIIFFHDILWKQLEKPHVQSWMSTTIPPQCWPRDWLKSVYPESRILSAHYDANRWKTPDGGHMDLYRLAENLMQDILEIYKKPPYETSCPIFLVGHGVGGLVIMSLVKAMQDKRDMLTRHEEFQNLSTSSVALQQLNCFLKSIRGVFYYATPFQGSELAESSKNHPNQGSLLGPLEVFSTETCRIKDDFVKWRKDSFCKAMAIFATLPTEVDRKRPSHVVTEASARGDVDDFYSVQCNHFDVCKPNSLADSRFGKLVQFLDQEILAIETGPVARIGGDSELLEDILSRVTGMQEGEAEFFAIDDLEKIRQCSELCIRLKAGFQDAGVEQIHVDVGAGHEVWAKEG